MSHRGKIRNINGRLGQLAAGETFWLGVLAEPHHDLLRDLGFSVPLVAGERLLPSADKGPACERNADGWTIVHRDQPMEIAYRQVEWHWKEFRGRYDTEDRSKIVEVPYKRYPRTEVPPFSVELEIRANPQGAVHVVVGPFLVEPFHNDRSTNSHNMLIELFGQCAVLRDDMTSWERGSIRQLNWELLPPGRNPWASAQPALERVVQRAEAGNQPVIRARFETIGKYGPDFVAVGTGGFDGYVVFGFPRLGICVLECRSVNNATYVLNEQSWDVVSMLSKAEILSTKVHRARLVHREGWFKAIAALLASHPGPRAAAA